MISGVVKLISGTPFTITATGVDLEFDGFAEARPVLLDPSVARCARRLIATRRSRRCRATAFRPATFGDPIEDLVPRNAFYGDGLETGGPRAVEDVRDAVVRP